jgi:hypothetical protein
MKVQVEINEPDKKKKIKRIIAREGLVIFGIIVFGVILEFCNIKGGIGVVILFFGYPVYLLARFIIWAVRELRNGK